MAAFLCVQSLNAAKKEGVCNASSVRNTSITMGTTAIPDPISYAGPVMEVPKKRWGQYLGHLDASMSAMICLS